MSLESGAQFGIYKIVSPLGAGGMGEVYRAADTKLDRQVALKVLPEAMGQDPERVARFEREAKVLASLNHLHIAAIYGFEEAAGKQFLILELVEGPTLEDRLQAGPLMVDESLDIARQIAEALEAAHEKNVIHRDLKPANVKITPDGTVKVLDFGLAKALTEESTEEDRGTSPTITRDFTQPGVILGTAAYMSPEQARGRAVDKRTDIWSFGCVLYECLTADSIFQGETVSDSLAAILHNEPDWERLPADTPPTVQLLLRRCLAKDHRQRLRDIGDVRLELEAAIADPSSSVLGLASEALAGTKGRPKKLRTAVAAVLIFVLGGLLSAAALWWLRPADKASDWQDLPLRKFEVVIGNNKVDGNEQRSISLAWPAISPDGKKIVYQWKTRCGFGRWTKRSRAGCSPAKESAIRFGPPAAIRWLSFTKRSFGRFLI
jgi:serine/threonine protein kinase